MKELVWFKKDEKYWFYYKNIEATIGKTWDKKFRLMVAKEGVDLDYGFSTLRKAKAVAEFFIANA